MLPILRPTLLLPPTSILPSLRLRPTLLLPPTSILLSLRPTLLLPPTSMKARSSFPLVTSHPSPLCQLERPMTRRSSTPAMPQNTNSDTASTTPTLAVTLVSPSTEMGK
uniref:Uncharacterized protein n=1 Tax=Cacopsylla melanoneura TaxID=428564 RepID=A0A8D8TRX5_9HEMI